MFGKLSVLKTVFSDDLRYPKNVSTSESNNIQFCSEDSLEFFSICVFNFLCVSNVIVSVSGDRRRAFLNNGTQEIAFKTKHAIENTTKNIVYLLSSK